MKTFLLGEKIVQDSGFKFSRNYIVFPPYRIEDGRIYENDKSILVEDYKVINLFHYYNSPMPRAIIADILGESAPSQLNPYTLFASINTNNIQEVIRWFNHFGYLDGKAKYDTKRRWYYCIEDFKKHVKDMNNVLNIIGALQAESEDIGPIMDDIRKQYNGFLPGSVCGYDIITKGDSEFLKDLYSKTDIFEIFTPSSLGRQYVDSLFQHYLSQVSPCIKWNDEGKDGHPSLSWTSGPMISQFYFMLALDITNGKMPRKCMNIKCKKYFTPTRKSNLYCSETCKERAKQHRYYERTRRNVMLQQSV